MIYPLSNTEFDIKIVYTGKRYIMQAKLAYQGESVERWEVRAGEKLMYFENNRPALVVVDSNRVPKWKMIKGIEYIKDKVQGALMLTDIWNLIEQQSTGKRLPTFQEVRNKETQ